MKRNITLSADEHLIDEARNRARQQKTTLNAVFRQWLRSFAAGQDAGQKYRELMANLEGVQSSGPFTRDEANER